jgi:hypothetical protein
MNVRTLAVAMLLVLTGCTSMNPVKTQDVDLAAQIRSGHVVARGDNVEIVTTDGRQHRFRVTAIDEGSVGGSGIAIPIDTIAQLKVRKFSDEKTAMLIDGIAISVIGIALLGFLAVAIAFGA